MNMRLFVASGIVLSVVLVTVMIGARQAEVSVRANREIQARIVPALRHLEQMRYGVIRVVSSTSELMVAKLTATDDGEADAAAQTETLLIHQGDDNVEDALAEIRGLYENAGGAPAYLRLGEIDRSYGQLLGQSEKIIAMVKADASARELAKAKETFEAIEMHALAVINRALAEAQDNANGNFSLMSDAATRLRNEVFALGLITVAVLFLYTTYVIRLLHREATARADAERLATANAEEVERRKRIEARLAAHQKMEALGTMLGGIAHSVNNFLVPIITLSGMMKKDMPEGSEMRDDLSRIEAAGEKASRLLRQVLAFSRASEARPSGSCDIVETTRRALGLAAASLPARVSIDQALEPREARVPVSEDDIDTILFNLIGNAVDAIGDAEGRIEVRLDEVTAANGLAGGTPVRLEAGDYVRLSVIDDGPGIPEPALAHIFEPFFTTKPVGKGTGLGLTITYNTVTQAGGDIVVSSAAGRGIRFDLLLPRLDGSDRTGDGCGQDTADR